MNANRGNQPSQSMRDHLVLFEPNGRKMLYEFVGPFVSIGRSAENDIVLPHANISRVHLQLTYSHDGWQAVDTGGVSGTYSGAYRLQPNQPYTLQPQEALTLGEYSLYWQPVDRHPHGWDSEPQTEQELLEEAPQLISSWYAASALATLAILLIGVWFMWQFSPSQSLPSLLSPQPPTLEERWEGEWATECEWLPCGTVSLEATDEGVVGHYLNGTGSLHGVVDGDRLVGVWLLGGASGTFEFVMSDQANTFNGMWDDRWQWCGAQEGVPLPAQCAQPIQ